MIAYASHCRSHVQTRTQSSLIHSRKGKWKGKLTRAKAFGKEAFIFFLPLMHRELTKSFPLITVRIQRSDY